MSYRLKPLNQQTVVITGASSGIGLATARRAAREGAKVVLVARNEDALREAAEDIEAAGGQAAWCAVDIADSAWPEKVGKVADDRFGGFDSWVNNAAASLYARLDEVTEEEHRRVFDVGYFGTVAGSLYAAKRLRERSGGALINTGSVLSERAVGVQGVYSAMKHAVKGFTDALRVELQEEDAGVSVTLIKPNGIDTPYPEHARNKMDRPASVPPVIYDPELAAKAICFACEHPRRELLVGGQGLLLTKAGNLFPGLTDLIMQNFMMEDGQSSDTPPEPGAEDNLFEPRKDGRVRSNQDNFVRKSSLALEAQMHPAVAIATGMGTIAAAGLIGALARSRRA
ncbi:SDR family NAD(P)-dependent oxidoreductase [Erythrobacteraceae bacterium CFH 75059]|uniref:SDR family oxidoreductase n=1 Tax=Qipengyuania thermophila TaxID=2509361 RepID=UPI001020323A|nr:SDR family oxidoreductase [Qipengyuania thermophila]TCD05376.1 SDR family NAD(P)-dependent oxidoreductase [Erythrobacteraceae bacterium CFH 75059]